MNSSADRAEKREREKKRGEGIVRTWCRYRAPDDRVNDPQTRGAQGTSDKAHCG